MQEHRLLDVLATRGKSLLLPEGVAESWGTPICPPGKQVHSSPLREVQASRQMCATPAHPNSALNQATDMC